MASLNVHQSKSSDHDRLGFHPDCPACRQDRLFGVLSPQPAFSYRVRALLAAGVLALSAGAATTSVASEPDSHEEGVSVPGGEGSPAPGDSTDDNAQGGQQQPDDELGQGPSDETPLPIEVEPVPSAPQDDSAGDGPAEGASPEPQPAEDPDAGLGLTDPGTPDTIDVEDVPVPPTQTYPPVAPAPPVAPPVDVDAPPEPPAAPPQERERAAHHGHKGDHRANDPAPRERHYTTAPAPPASVPPPEDAPAVSAAQVDPAPPPPGTARFHVVQRGESLWSIAAHLLGPNASAAAIASEVQRLWDLNSARIGTGDPDLLSIGVKLRLR